MRICHKQVLKHIDRVVAFVVVVVIVGSAAIVVVFVMVRFILSIFEMATNTKTQKLPVIIIICCLSHPCCCCRHRGCCCFSGTSYNIYPIN